MAEKQVDPRDIFSSSEANRPYNGSSFRKIHIDTLKLIDNPNPPEEQQNRNELDAIYGYAKNIGLFLSLSQAIKDIQDRIGNDPSLGQITFLAAIDNIESLERTMVPYIENNFKNDTSNIGWDDRFSGMPGEYVSVAVLAMRHAWLEANADTTRDPNTLAEMQRRADRLERQINLRKFNDIPQEMYGKAEDAARERQQTPQNPNQPTNGQDRTAEAMERIAPPGEVIRRRFVILERVGGLDQSINSNNLAEGLINKNEIMFWQERLRLNEAVATKQLASKPDEILANPQARELRENGLNLLTNYSKNGLSVADIICIYSAYFAGRGNVDLIRMKRSEDFETFRIDLAEQLVSKGFDVDVVFNFEQIALGFVKLTGLPEQFDSERVGGLDRILNVTLRDIMHPMAKLRASIRNRQTWPSNVIGEWAIQHTNGPLNFLGNTTVQIGNLGGSIIEAPFRVGTLTKQLGLRIMGPNSPLPIRLVRGIVGDVFYVPGVIVETTGKGIRRVFETPFNVTGNILRFPARSSVPRDLLPNNMVSSALEYQREFGLNLRDMVRTGVRLIHSNNTRGFNTNLDWSGADEHPFENYFNRKLGNAVLIFNTLTGTGLPEKKTLVNLRDAWRNLRTLTHSQKMLTTELVLNYTHPQAQGWLSARRTHLTPRKYGLNIRRLWRGFYQSNGRDFFN